MRYCLPVALLLSTLPVNAAEVSSSQSKKFRKQLQGFVKGERRGALREFIVRMVELDHKRSVIYIPPAATLVPSSTNYRAAVEGIASIVDPDAIAELAKVLSARKTDFREKVLLLQAFGRRDDKASLDAIIERLDDKVAHVEVAAIRAARARKAAAPVAGLIDALDRHWKRRDRAFLEARMALIAITGQDFEDIVDWKKWWDTAKATFDPAKVGKTDGKTQVPVRRTVDSVEFFGSEVFSSNLIFVIDVSGSMYKYDEAKSRSDDQEFGDPQTTRRRVVRAQKQLIQALEKLKRGTMFNIVAFSNQVTSWSEEMQSATRSSINSAKRFVTNFNAIGPTHTDEALKRSFEDVTVDTIILLSDGAPLKVRREGHSEKLIKEILTWFRDINSSRKVRVDTFGFEGRGKWPKKVPFAPGGQLPEPPTDEELKLFVDFLKTLSEESGGTYRAIE